MILEEVMCQEMFYKNQGVRLTLFVLYTKCDKNIIRGYECVVFWYDQLLVFNLRWFPVLPLL